jgi:hypothetical protein
MERLIVPTGILSFALFLAAMVSGFIQWRAPRLHAAAGYACCLAVIVHSAAAIICQIFEPVGILASAGMILTAASGAYRPWKPAHITLAIVTLVLSVAHVVIIKVAVG